MDRVWRSTQTGKHRAVVTDWLLMSDRPVCWTTWISRRYIFTKRTGKALSPARDEHCNKLPGGKELRKNRRLFLKELNLALSCKRHTQDPWAIPAGRFDEAFMFVNGFDCGGITFDRGAALYSYSNAN